MVRSLRSPFAPKQPENLAPPSQSAQWRVHGKQSAMETAVTRHTPSALHTNPPIHSFIHARGGELLYVGVAREARLQHPIYHDVECAFGLIFFVCTLRVMCVVSFALGVPPGSIELTNPLLYVLVGRLHVNEVIVDRAAKTRQHALTLRSCVPHGSPALCRLHPHCTCRAAQW